MAVEIKGSWMIYNLCGVGKRFKTADSPEAITWMSDRSLPIDREAVRAEKARLREEQIAERDAARVAKFLAKQEAKKQAKEAVVA